MVEYCLAWPAPWVHLLTEKQQANLSNWHECLDITATSLFQEVLQDSDGQKYSHPVTWVLDRGWRMGDPSTESGWGSCTTVSFRTSTWI